MAREAGDTDFGVVNVATVVKVAGTAVLGTQGTTPAFVNQDLPNTVTRVNAIITLLEAHGLSA